MAASTNTTSVKEPPSEQDRLFNDALATAWRELEGELSDARWAARVVETVAEDTLNYEQGEVIAGRVRRYIIGDEDLNAFFFCLSDLTSRIRKLDAAYHAAFEQAQQAARKARAPAPEA